MTSKLLPTNQTGNRTKKKLNHLPKKEKTNTFSLNFPRNPKRKDSKTSEMKQQVSRSNIPKLDYLIDKNIYIWKNMQLNVQNDSSYPSLK